MNEPMNLPLQLPPPPPIHPSPTAKSLLLTLWRFPHYSRKLAQFYRTTLKLTVALTISVPDQTVISGISLQMIVTTKFFFLPHPRDRLIMDL